MNIPSQSANARPSMTNNSSHVIAETNVRPQPKYDSLLPPKSPPNISGLHAPRANPPLPQAGISRPVRNLLEASLPGGVRGVCNEHCNPQCLWDETKNDFATPLPEYTPKNPALKVGCKQLCRNETCRELDTASRQGMFKSAIWKATEAIPGVKHIPTANRLGNIAAGAYNWYGERFTGTHQDRVKAAIRERRERDPYKSPDIVVTQQPKYSTDRRMVTQQPRPIRGGTRHIRAKKTRHQKKKQRKKSRKHRRTKHRRSVPRGTRKLR